jgi:hypothetical protein
MVAGGVKDVFVSNEVVAPRKLQRLVALAAQGGSAQRVCTRARTFSSPRAPATHFLPHCACVHVRPGARVSVVVDAPGPLEQLAAAAAARGVSVDVLVEVNAGQDRCGVDTPEAAAQLAERVAQLSQQHNGAVSFAGIQVCRGQCVQPQAPIGAPATTQQPVALLRSSCTPAIQRPCRPPRAPNTVPRTGLPRRPAARAGPPQPRGSREQGGGARSSSSGGNRPAGGPAVPHRDGGWLWDVPAGGSEWRVHRGAARCGCLAAAAVCVCVRGGGSGLVLI